MYCNVAAKIKNHFTLLIYHHGDHCSVGAEAFMGALLPRLRTASNGQGPIMPFELEVN